jgi:opacity protein-like surface antigen
MKRALLLSALLALFATLVFCADITGKWKGTFAGGDQERELTFDFAVKGDALTGTVSGMLDHALEIKDGKIQGDSVTFWIQSEYQGQPVKLMYKGQVSGSEIRFSMGNEEGSWSTDLVAKKSS